MTIGHGYGACAADLSEFLVSDDFPAIGARPLTPFLVGVFGSPTKIDHGKKGALILASLLEDLGVSDGRVPFEHGCSLIVSKKRPDDLESNGFPIEPTKGQTFGPGSRARHCFRSCHFL